MLVTQGTSQEQMSQSITQQVDDLKPEDIDGPATPSIYEVEENLKVLANSPRLPSYTKTRNVRLQFQHAFELIGGIPRLAHWAHANPDKFYQLYSKLIPAQVTGLDGGAIKVELSWLNARDTSGKSPPQIIDVEPTNGL
jgi:hypothetical protein